MKYLLGQGADTDFGHPGGAKTNVSKDKNLSSLRNKVRRYPERATANKKALYFTNFPGLDRGGSSMPMLI